MLAIAFVAPFVWMIATSLKTRAQAFTIPPSLIPKPVYFRNYYEAWVDYVPFTLYLKNTFIITIGSMVGTILSSSVVAFSFARLRWPGRDLFFILILGSLMLPYHVTLIPVFILFKLFGWINTFLPLIVPNFFGNAFFVFFLRQFITTIPFELDEAARIDGASTSLIFWRIVMPLCKPALATVAIFSFMFNWNELIMPLIYLNKEKLYTITLGMTIFRSQSEVYWNHLMATAVLAMLPPLALFFFAQKWFIQGITVTGLKG
jgi:ABC-type glycerol-3-phosphate transport system permease component